MDTTRVSDTDREHTAEFLRLAVGDGRLTVAEVDARMQAAYAAVTRADLDRVTADLPAPARTPISVAVDARDTTEWRDAWRAWLGGALIMIGIWLAVSLARGEATGFWPAFPIGIWASVLIATRMSGRAPHPGCARH